MSDFANDPAVIDWFTGVRRGHTKRNYSRIFAEFCEYTGMTPLELRNFRLEDLKATDPMAAGRSEKLVKDWYAQLSGAPRSKALKYFVVRSFYAKTIPKKAGALDADLVPIDRTRVRPPGKPTLDEVRSLCQIASVRTRAMILWETKTGCRPETSVNIRMRDIDHSQGFPWIVYPKHTKSSDTGNITFCDEEAGEAMVIYWKDRGVGDDSDLHVFTNEYASKEPLNPESFSGSITTVMNRAKGSGMVRPEIRPYGLRKLFQTEMERAHVPHNWIKRMMSHSMGDVESAYSQAEIEDMREEYRSATERGFLQVFSKPEPQFTEEQKRMMRNMLTAVRENLRDEFDRMVKAEALANGPDTLARVVMREIEMETRAKPNWVRRLSEFR